jgi:hypothetical protein
MVLFVEYLGNPSKVRPKAWNQPIDQIVPVAPRPRKPFVRREVSPFNGNTAVYRRLLDLVGYDRQAPLVFESLLCDRSWR